MIPASPTPRTVRASAAVFGLLALALLFAVPAAVLAQDSGNAAPTDDEILAELRQRHIEACNNQNDRNLNERLIDYRDKVCPVAGASNRGMTIMDQAIEIFVPYERLTHEAIAKSYMDMVGLDARDWYAIALYCVVNDLRALAEHAAVETVHEDAERRQQVNLLVARLRGESGPPAGGYIAIRRPNRLGRFVTASEAEAIQYELDVIDAMEALDDVDIDSAEGEKAIAHAVETLGRKPELAKEAIRNQHDQLVREIEECIGENEKLDKVKEKLDDARKDALEVIYDKSIYPDENHGRPGQPTVDREVDKVKRLWGNRTSGNKVPQEARAKADRLRKIVRIGEAMGVFGEKEATSADNLGRWIEVVAGEKLTIKNYATDNDERGRIADYHDVERQNNEGSGLATGEERAHASIVNEYRHMMGRHPLALNDRLTTSSRRHSQYMAGGGKFAHNVPGHPDGASPQDRMKKQGYEHQGSENIAYASRGHSAGSSFRGWYNSSGHHRNMLNSGWKVFGVGAAGTHWTQNFGAKPDGKEHRQNGR